MLLDGPPSGARLVAGKALLAVYAADERRPTRMSS
jgi:hypothetical protein